MYNIAIIGVGQLGSRHLQGLKLASSSLNITVLDSNTESIKISKERYDAIPPIGEKTVKYITTFDDIPSHLDLAIVATGSKPRAAIVKMLLKHAKVRYLILEKVLFPILDDYDEIASLLKSEQVRCWVNCPRRMYGMYKQIKEMVDSSKPIIMSYANENWGLCCNAIHMLDTFMFLNNADSYMMDITGLHNQLERSKRDGYIEMIGTIHFETHQGHKLTLISENNYTGFMGMRINNGDNTFMIDEVQNEWSLNGSLYQYRIPYQSQLTGLLVDEILISGGCSLPSYDISSSYHKLFIGTLLHKYNEIISDFNNKLLPIT